MKDKDEDLTREPEQIKAYRDTWKLGIHSYLTYLRDRLLLAKDLLHESGSIFVQINDENLHLVRSLMDEMFGREHFVAVIAFRKAAALGKVGLSGVADYLLWYAKDKNLYKYNELFIPKEYGEETRYARIEDQNGLRKRISQWQEIPEKGRYFVADKLSSAGLTPSCVFDFDFNECIYNPANNTSWRTNPEGMKRLEKAERLFAPAETLTYIQYFDDFPVMKMSNIWLDLQGAPEKLFAVQTNTKVIDRCILMTTDLGNLVFDPTCGSGTTAFCAEKWGRRWITCDTSRVALSIARQRLMTARFDYYELNDPERGPSGGFIYETVPHVTLESIAKNTEIDVIATKYQPQIDDALNELNKALGKDFKEWEVLRNLEMPKQVRHDKGTSSKRHSELVSESDRIQKAQEAHERFWTLKRQKRKEIDREVGSGLAF